MWWATGPEPDIAPTPTTRHTETALEWARERARLYGAALLWWVRPGRPALLVATVWPDVGPDGELLPPSTWFVPLRTT